MTELWGNALSRLSSKISQQNFDMWLRPIECCGVKDNTIVLRAPNPYVRLWFESNYMEFVLDEICSDASAEFSVQFAPDREPPEAQVHREARPKRANTASPDRPEAPKVSATEPTHTKQSPGAQRDLETDSHAREDGRSESTQLNSRYTFETFVAGPSNQLAYAAAHAAASSQPPKYNPIFICGGVGLGKTHLLHAIGHHFRNQDPSATVLYLSGERFMNEYIHAIRTSQMHEFRRRYRERCEVLLVDDVQFLAGKDGTQDEFFHTFNALHDTHRQIVLTADRKPFEISDVADRLRTRFAWGLLADIEPPELEVRVAILRKKAAAESIRLPDDVALYIASAIKSNVRELEGALIRLAAYASLSQRKIDLPFAQETLEGSVTRPREHLTSDAIIKSVAHYYGLKVSDIKSSRRHKSVAGPRAVAMYLARTHTADSYPDLGRAFGGKHHTTVISAVEKITNRIKNDPSLRGEIHAIEGVLLR
ncbi:MAG: chromosomal replication initiator protein DnaA [Proteobacteria bacterium]|nr:chromosomal replication initiator protein DnaA [Pseudomonadota bacterium]